MTGERAGGCCAVGTADTTALPVLLGSNPKICRVVQPREARAQRPRGQRSAQRQARPRGLVVPRTAGAGAAAKQFVSRSPTRSMLISCARISATASATRSPRVVVTVRSIFDAPLLAAARSSTRPASDLAHVLAIASVLAMRRPPTSAQEAAPAEPAKAARARRGGGRASSRLRVPHASSWGSREGGAIGRVRAALGAELVRRTVVPVLTSRRRALRAARCPRADCSCSSPAVPRRPQIGGGAGHGAAAARESGEPKRLQGRNGLSPPSRERAARRRLPPRSRLRAERATHLAARATDVPRIVRDSDVRRGALRGFCGLTAPLLPAEWMRRRAARLRRVTAVSPTPRQSSAPPPA